MPKKPLAFLTILRCFPPSTLLSTQPSHEALHEGFRSPVHPTWRDKLRLSLDGMGWLANRDKDKTESEVLHSSVNRRGIRPAVPLDKFHKVLSGLGTDISEMSPTREVYQTLSPPLYQIRSLLDNGVAPEERKTPWKALLRYVS